MGLGLRHVQPFEHLPDPAVRPGAPAARKVFVERVPDEAMGEPETSADLRHLDHHVGRDRRIQDLEQLIPVADPAERGEGELAPEYRRLHKQVGAAVRQVRQALRDHLLDGRRKGGATGCLVAEIVQASLGGQQPDDLFHEQRIALGLAMDGCGQRLGGVDLGRQLDVARDVELGQAGQPQPAGRVVTVELGQRGPQRVIARQLHVSVGSDDEDLHVRDLAGDELQQQQRRRVGGLQVVEHQDERCRAGRVAEKRRRGVE